MSSADIVIHDYFSANVANNNMSKNKLSVGPDQS